MRSPLPSRVLIAAALAAGAFGLFGPEGAAQSGPPPSLPLSSTAQTTTSIEWAWNPVTGATGYEIHDGGHQIIATVGGTASRYLETGLEENTTYQRHIHAVNPSGMSAMGLEANVYTRIHTPLVTEFSLQAVSGNRVEITISLPPNPASGSAIVYRSTNQSSWTEVGNTASYWLADTGVSASTVYYYRIRYTNGTPTLDSEAQSITTPAATPAPPAAPASFSGTGQSTTSILWTWTAVSGATSYDVHDENHVLLQNVPGTSCTESGLTENTPRQRHVHARNANGAGPRSNEAVIYTLARTPSASDMTLTVVTGAQIDVRIAPLPNRTFGGSAAVIEVSSNGTSGWTPVATDNGPGTTFYACHTGRSPNTPYYYRFKYFNGNGVQTAYLSPAQNVTTSAAPALPANQLGSSWTQVSTTQVQWNWNAVSGATGYELHDENHNVIVSAAAGVQTHTESGLTENTPIVRHFHVRFGSVLATQSATYIAFPRIHTPTLADFDVSTLSSYSTEVRVHHPVNWNAAGYQPITVYRTDCSIQHSLDNSSWTEIKSPFFEPGFGIKNHLNLAPGTTQYYRIALRAAGGWMSPYSPSLAINTPADVPVSPGSLAAAGAGPGTITWQWGNVAGETGYVLHDGNHTQMGSPAPENATSMVESALGENVFTIRHLHAQNAVGLSAATTPGSGSSGIHNPTTSDFSLSVPVPGVIRVTVVPPANPRSRRTGVLFRYSTDNASWSTIGGLTGSYVFDHAGRVGNTTHYYQILYRNAFNYETAWSPSLNVAAPLWPPATFIGTTVSSTSLQWTWSDIVSETSYELHDANHNLIQTLAANSTSYMETVGLAENTPYSRHLHALQGTTPSPASVSSAPTTGIHTPVDADFTVTATGASTVQVEVVQPNNATVGSTGCEISRAPAVGSFQVVKSFSNLYSFQDSGLSASTQYRYKIRYQNAAAIPSGESPIKPVTTLAPPPAPPTNLQSSTQTVNSITWSWTDAAAETSYLFHDVDHNLIGNPLPANSTTLLESGLSENTQYSRHLHSQNASGPGNGSSPANVFTRVHDALVTDFTLTVLGNTQVNVVVTPPPNPSGPLGGSTGVAIERSANGSTWAQVRGFSSVYTWLDTTVQKNKTYYYRIRFQNGNGIAAGYSPAQIVVTSAPTAPTGFAGAGHSTSSIQWTWNPQVGETAYLVHTPAEAVVTNGNVAANVTTCIETGLSENTSYTRHVHATNGIGTSPGSTAASSYSQVHTPTAGEFTLTAYSSTRIDVSVTAPPGAANGSTGWRIRRSTDQTNWSIVKDFNQGVNVFTPFQDITVVSGTLYYYHIAFCNGNGLPSGYSPTKSKVAALTPVITTASKKTRNVNAVIQGTASVSATVKVYYDGNLDGTATNTNGNWTYASATKSEGVYTVTARATEGAMTSQDSNAITVEIDTTPPAPPTNIRLACFTTVIDVLWDPSPTSDLAGYQIYRRAGSTGDWTLLNTPGLVLGTQYRDSTINAGTTYFYRVAAMDNAVSD